MTLYEDETPQAVIARGALQMQVQPRDQARFDTLAASDLFEPGALERLDAAEAGRRLGEPAAAGALVLRGALVVEPRPMLEAWLMGCARISAEAAALERAGGFWRVLDAGGTTICEAEVRLPGGGGSRPDGWRRTWPCRPCAARPASPTGPMRPWRRPGAAM